MNNYEVTIVLPADAKDKEALARIEKEIQDAGGKVEKTEEWGKRKLAYTIKKYGGPAGGHREGVYFFMEVQLPPEKTSDVNRFLETNEAVLRHLLVKVKSHKPSLPLRGKVKVKNITKKVVKKNGNKKSK